MGLDMYLTRKTYVKNWDHQKPEEKHMVTVLKGGKPVAAIKPERISYITEEMGYWRKANQIHKWFVTNCQGGEDRNGDDTYVSREQLAELLALCERVIKASKLKAGKVVNGYTYKDGKEQPILESGKVIVNPEVAKELLPAESGFFFGSTEYDQYYLDNLKYTVKILREVLAEPEIGEFYYQSSW